MIKFFFMVIFIFRLVRVGVWVEEEIGGDI